jgi:zinc carboxypeptidase
MAATRALLAVLCAAFAASASAADALDPGVPTPKSVLGHDIGEYHTSYLGVVRYTEALARAVPDRVKLVPIGESYEHRPMMLLVISSPANLARLEQVQADLARLTDPRGTSEAEAEEIIRRTPAVTWDNFGNDGNESAAVEAALEMAYRLAASRGGEIEKALERVVAVLNVCHNPESRERFVDWYNASQVGARGTADPQALEHHGPWGMDTNNNHYQIDLNRDSVWATQQETRNVIAAYRQWNPQTFIDHHGETENFFFPPVALPVNPNLPQFHLDWLETYGRAIAAASDRHGWSYFTGETFDEFYPGYWDAYPFLKGAIGFTFETNAGGYTGLRVERDDQTVVTLRDGVDKHVEGGLAVLLTTAAERERKLRDYWRFRKSGIEEGSRGPVRAYMIVPGHDPGRAAELAQMLMRHGIEVRRTAGPVELPRATDYLTRTAAPRKVPAGAYVVALDQPEKRMIQAVLEPRTEQQAAFLEEERRKRTFNRRRGRNVPAERDAFYDVTAWALPYAYGVEAYAAHAPVAAELLSAPPEVRGMVTGGRANTAYLFDPRTLGSTKLALALLREGFKLAVARKAFTTAGSDWPAGTFVVRRERNPEALHARLPALAEAAGVEVVAVHTAWTEKGPDLGSATLDSLKPPRMAVLADAPTDDNAYGAIWFLLERRLDQPFTALRADDVATADLSRYDVVVLPDGAAASYKKRLGDDGLARLTAWVKDGGTLVCTGGASALAADRKVAWTKARVLGPPDDADAEDKEQEQEKEDDAKDEEARPAEEPAPPAAPGAPPALETERELRKQEERRRQETELTPGAIFAAELDGRHFLAYGYDAQLVPVLVTSDRVLSASPSGANVVRIRPADPLLSGFAWPEAVERLRGAAYLVDEPLGRGHVVLFADDPNFRNFWRGLEKLFTNALLLAPSLK